MGIHFPLVAVSLLFPFPSPEPTWRVGGERNEDLDARQYPTQRLSIQVRPVHPRDAKAKKGVCNETKECNGCEEMKTIRIFYSTRYHDQLKRVLIGYKSLPFHRERLLK